MCCDEQNATDGSDRLQGEAGSRHFDASSTAWLVGQAVRHLNQSGEEAELGYQHTAELLRRCGEEVTQTIVDVFRQTRAGDTPLRWNLLYVLGDAGDRSAIDFLVETAIQRITEVDPDQGCESARDMDILISTMAVEALQRIVRRHPESSRALLEIINRRPVPPILIEAVKAASDLDLQDEVRKILPEHDHWILDIRHARTEEVFADAEREDGMERGFTPPRAGIVDGAPTIGSKER